MEGQREGEGGDDAPQGAQGALAALTALLQVPFDEIDFLGRQRIERVGVEELGRLLVGGGGGAGGAVRVGHQPPSVPTDGLGWAAPVAGSGSTMPTRPSRAARSFCMPSRMRVLMVPKGVCSIVAISAWVRPL